MDIFFKIGQLKKESIFKQVNLFNVNITTDEKGQAMDQNIIPQEALFSIFEGNALLFLGAGFSIGAKCSNSKNENVPGGQGLADILMNELQSGDGKQYSLDKASEFYENSHNRKALLDFISPYLSISDAQEYHKKILSHPWGRIYTTNYDNLIEKAGSLPKRLRRVGLQDTIPHYTDSTVECLCINGYMAPPLSESDIVITTHDYAGPRKENREELINAFRVDVSVSKSVFFLGYSLYDIELARILQEDTGIKSKVFLITGKNTNKLEEALFAKYGTVVKIDCSELPEWIESAYAEYINIPKNIEHVYSTLSLYEHKNKTISHEQVYDLIIKSKIDRFALKNAIIKRESSYAVLLEKLDIIIERIQSGVKNIVIHSHMCNGKTVLLEELAARLTEFYPVYFATQSSTKLNRDLLQLSKNTSGTAVVIIDGYATAFNEFSTITQRLDNIILILAERTAIHNQLQSHITKKINPDIFSINQLSDADIDSFINLVKSNGLTGTTPAVLKRKISLDYERSLGKTILQLFDDTAISGRVIREIRDVFKAEGKYKHEAYGAIIISIILGQSFEKSILNQLVEKNTAYSADFRDTSLFHEILRATDDTIYCPGTLAQFIAKKAFDPDFALEMTIRIAKVSRQNIHRNLFKRISTELMRFSVLEKILPVKNFLDNTIRFYAELKMVGNLGTMPLFWLQYAIAYINKEKYDIAQRYLLTAYDLAKGTDFNVFQIDNQYARLLLGADESGIKESLFDRFKKAEAIIRRQIVQSNDVYAYRASGALISFRHFFNQFTTDEIKRILSFIDFLESQYEKLPEDIRNEARWDMGRIRDAKASAVTFLPS